jgi:hypothetical protein
MVQREYNTKSNCRVVCVNCPPTPQNLLNNFKGKICRKIISGVAVVVKVKIELLPTHTAGGGDSSIFRNVDKFLPDPKYRHTSNQAT